MTQTIKPRIVTKYLTLILLSLWLAAPAMSQGFSLCHAEVTAADAKFFFPVHADDEWRWNRKETPDNSPEYGWEVIVSSSSGEYVLGAYLFKLAGSKEKWGKTSDIVAETRPFTARIEGEGDAAHHVIEPGIKMGIAVKDNGIVLVLSGKPTLDKVMAGKPKEAIFNIFQPDQIDSISCPGPVDYK